MAKKPSRSGGRVTPKGTQPRRAHQVRLEGPTGRRPPLVNRFDPAQNQRGGGSSAPTRAGHHRGQR